MLQVIRIISVSLVQLVMSRSAGRHQRNLHREAPVINVSSRQAAEETAWRIKSVKLEQDRHAQHRHLNPLNMADTFRHLIASFKGRHQDAILVSGEVLDDATNKSCCHEVQDVTYLQHAELNAPKCQNALHLKLV